MFKVLQSSVDVLQLHKRVCKSIVMDSKGIFLPNLHLEARKIIPTKLLPTQATLPTLVNQLVLAFIRYTEWSF